MTSDANKVVEKNRIIAEFDGSMIVRKYNTDWNDLMPALHKWDNLIISEFHQEAYIHLCELLDDKIICYEIEPVYLQFIECLEWYNNIYLQHPEK